MSRTFKAAVNSMMPAFSQSGPFAARYTHLASVYDATIGVPYFRETRRVFDELIRRHGIRFSSAADIGCGTGLFAAYLSASRRIPVMGVDRSASMLAAAARNNSGLNVRLLCQDIRVLHLPCPVALITANFDTLNHILRPTELFQVFRRIFESLKPGGHFFFDVITPCLPLKSRTIYTRRIGRAARQLIQRISWDPLKRVLSTVVEIKPARIPTAVVEVHHERAYWPIEIIAWLRKVGFIIRGVHDAFTLRMALHCSPRIIVIAQKP